MEATRKRREPILEAKDLFMVYTLVCACSGVAIDTEGKRLIDKERSSLSEDDKRKVVLNLDKNQRGESLNGE